MPVGENLLPPSGSSGESGWSKKDYLSIAPWKSNRAEKRGIDSLTHRLIGSLIHRLIGSLIHLLIGPMSQ
jgi:hypothetical protein